MLDVKVEAGHGLTGLHRDRHNGLPVSLRCHRARTEVGPRVVMLCHHASGDVLYGCSVTPVHRVCARDRECDEVGVSVKHRVQADDLLLALGDSGQRQPVSRARPRSADCLPWKLDPSLNLRPRLRWN